MTVKDLKDHLSGWPDGTPVAYMLWVPDDIKSSAKRQGLKNPNKEQIADILEDVERHKDCSYGISWDNIDYHVAQHVEMKKKNKYDVKKKK